MAVNVRGLQQADAQAPHLFGGHARDRAAAAAAASCTLGRQADARLHTRGAQKNQRTSSCAVNGILTLRARKNWVVMPIRMPGGVCVWDGLAAAAAGFLSGSNSGLSKVVSAGAVTSVVAAAWRAAAAQSWVGRWC